MLFTTFSQFVALLLLFFGGLVLGLGLHPGGRKWRKRLYAESEAYSAYRRRTEGQLRDSRARIAELERETETLKGTAAAPDAPIAEPEPTPPPEPVVEAVEADDLSRLRGVDEPLKARLAELGIKRFADIENLSALDEMALEQRLDLPAGRIESDQWREQATLLRTGKTKVHSTRFPTV